MTMTPEERAAKVVADIQAHIGDLYDPEENRIETIHPGFLARKIAAAIREAVEAEREECAMLCDELYAKEWNYDPAIASGARDCAALIRARSKPTSISPHNLPVDGRGLIDPMRSAEQSSEMSRLQALANRDPLLDPGQHS
jgi:hypothetical protein